jgi:hypothetical protein
MRDWVADVLEAAYTGFHVLLGVCGKRYSKIDNIGHGNRVWRSRTDNEPEVLVGDLYLVTYNR